MSEFVRDPEAAMELLSPKAARSDEADPSTPAAADGFALGQVVAARRADHGHVW